jgi:hypothetical protein
MRLIQFALMFFSGHEHHLVALCMTELQQIGNNDISIIEAEGSLCAKICARHVRIAWVDAFRRLILFARDSTQQ